MKEYPYERYGSCRIRVIIDTDCACEGDDAFAVAHALLTPKFDVRAITAANYMHMPGSVENSRRAVEQLLDVMGLSGRIRLLSGSMPMMSETEYETSPASDFIVEEALREDERPLFIACQGAITNLAVALKTCPEIAENLHCIWIGGGAYPSGGYEFNLMNDLAAARTVLGSAVSLWQVPQNVYSRMNVSFMRLYEEMAGDGAVGRYLWEQLLEFHRAMCDKYQGRPSESGLAGPLVPMRLKKEQPESFCGFGTGESWSLGDSPVVGLMMDARIGDCAVIGAPALGDDGSYNLCPENPRKITVYENINAPFILEDFFSKMRYQYGK